MTEGQAQTPAAAVKPPTKPESPVEQRRKAAKEALKRAQEILAEHGGLHSNIPITNEFWDLMNTHRAAMSLLGGPIITDPYVELPADVIAKIPRPAQIESDAREARKHYDRQHPETLSLVQAEIQKATEALKTPEQKKEEEKLQKEAEERDAKAAKVQDEINQRQAKEEERRAEFRKKELEEQQKLREKLLAQKQRDEASVASPPPPIKPEHGTN